MRLRYDRLIGTTNLIARDSDAPAAAPAVAAAPVTVAQTQSGPVALSDAPVRVNVPTVASARPVAGTQSDSPLSSSLSVLPENKRIYLVINDFKARSCGLLRIPF